MNDKDKARIEENRQIDKIFEQIKAICEEYLKQHYPAAPDPDVYMIRIENQVQKYDHILGADIS